MYVLALLMNIMDHKELRWLKINNDIYWKIEIYKQIKHYLCTFRPRALITKLSTFD